MFGGFRTAAAAGLLVVMLGGCSTTATNSAPVASSASSVSPSSPQPGPTEPQSQIYAAVINQLTHVDHTFGSMPDPFGRVFVLDRAASRSSNLQFDTDGERYRWAMDGGGERRPDQHFMTRSVFGSATPDAL